MEIHQLVGPLPSWAELGPPQEMEGVEVRELLGDWSHLPEMSRPPKYLSIGPLIAPRGIDRSETREDVKVKFPGKNIKELKGLHSGKVALLFNGESMGKLDLHKITVPIIGMNRTHVGWPTYKGPQPDYLCIVDHDWLVHPEWRRGVLKHERIINGSDHKEDIGYRVARNFRMSPFSFDLGRDGYVCPIPCTTGHLALQLAVYLGFTELYCLGWDLQGKHFDQTSGSRNYVTAYSFHKRQAEPLRNAGIKVFLVESPESRLSGVFPAASFEAICG